MPKNFDEYADDDDIPVRPIARAQIRPLAGTKPPQLIMIAHYFENAEDAAAGKTASINLMIGADAAEQLGAALIDTAKTLLKESAPERRR